MKSTPGYIGENLKKARLSRKMTATSLADQLGVTKQAISGYETGRKTPSSDVAEKICGILNFPMSFFLKDNNVNYEFETPSFYRSMSVATKSARQMAEQKFEWLLDLVFLLETFVEFPLVNFPDIECPSDPTKISDEFIEEVADEVRHFWGLRDGPISNSVWLLENNGVVVVRRALECETLDAFSRWVNARPYIILGNEKQCSVRSRFDLAHELGHLILHRNVPEQILKNPTYFKLIESQAHRFSAAFHFPQTSFSQEVIKPSLEKFRLLKKRWKLSIAMMIKRAEHLNFISSEQAQTFWRNYTRRGWKKAEPFDDVIEVEIPKLIQEAIQVVLEEGILNSSDLHKELNLYLSDIEDCAGLPYNFFNPKPAQIIQLTPRIKSDKEQTQYAKPADIVPFSRV